MLRNPLELKYLEGKLNLKQKANSTETTTTTTIKIHKNKLIIYQPLFNT